jgi:hypothetical protein
VLNEDRRRTENSSPVCVAGMHRSGTSTVAQLLYRCGLYLGKMKDLRAARSDNPEGYWEHRRLARLNERILESFGGGWDFPPPLEEGWQEDERLSILKMKAKRMLSPFEGHEPWGWKDPRNSLTLPFWTSLLPETKVVVCLRNPLEVARSLHERGYSSPAFSFNLWITYNQRLLDALQEGCYIVTHYQAYFHRPQKELRRVLDFLELPASDQLIANACYTTLKRDLRSHHNRTQELLKSDSPPQLKDLYLGLCREANWGYKAPAVSEHTGDG